MSRRPRHPLSLLLLAISVGCSWITKPDDDVARCETAEDCDQPEDNRYQTLCKFGDKGLEEDLDPADVDMVCVADYALVSCNPNDFDDTHPVTVLKESLSASEYAAKCEGEQEGNMGCPGPDCDDGLSVNEQGFCDDDDPDTPPAIQSNSGDYLHQDVLDQFCRSFFCDLDFVCDTDGHNCKPCDPDMPYGNSGCGDLYLAGELSCVYTTAAELKDSCKAPDSDWNDPTFGECPES
jgi:hypothetical protein